MANGHFGEHFVYQQCRTLCHAPGTATGARRQYGEYHDRADLTLSGNQNMAFEALLKTGAPIVSILLASKPHCIDALLAESAAVLIAFNPGARGGSAIVECLFGDFNPCGRLPISFPRHVGQLPVYYNQAPGWHASLSLHYDAGSHYVDLPATPLLAFGEGLNYSDIDYAHASLGRNQCTLTDTLQLSLALTNHSEREAVEVVQVYKCLSTPGVTSPEKQLHAFLRVAVPAHQTIELELALPIKTFTVLDKNINEVNYRGKVVLMVGKSSKTEDLQNSVFYILWL